MKLNVKAFGLSLGILWGASLIIMALVAMYSANNYGAGFVSAVGTLYIGYKITIPGAIIGGIWGFIDAGIGGAILAWLYNKLAK